MKLEKANQIIILNIKEAGKKMPPDVKDALTLGSEAIERELAKRSQLAGLVIAPLPSETED
ncbi:hypothetical protein ES703_100770 [subsurface metagenome]